MASEIANLFTTLSATATAFNASIDEALAKGAEYEAMKSRLEAPIALGPAEGGLASGGVGAVAGVGGVAAADEAAVASAARDEAVAHDEAAAAAARHGGGLKGLAGDAGNMLGIMPLIKAAAPLTIGAIGLESLKASTDFQTLTTQLVTGAGESQSNLESVRQGIMALGPQVGITSTELAKGLYNIESAGFHGAAGLDILKAAAEGAAVGGADMATVADGLTSAMNAYRDSGQNATQMTNDLVATVAAGKMHMQDLASSLGMVLPAASAAGVSLQDVSAAIATMTAQGTPAADAATYLRQTILMLENPSAKAQDAMKGIGLTAEDVSNSLREHGLSGTLAMITQRLGQEFPVGSQQYIAALADMVGGTKSMQAALELTGPNMATFQQNVQAISKASHDGTGDVHGFAEVSQDFGFKLDQAKAFAQNLAINLGNVLIPVIENVASFIMNSVVPALQQFGGWMDQHVMPLVTALANWIGQHVVPALQTLGDIISTDVLPPLANFATTIVDHIQPVMDWISDHFELVKPIIIGVGAALAYLAAEAAVSAIIEGVASAVGVLTAAFDLLAANPIVLVIIAVAAAVYELYEHWQQVLDIAAAIGSFFENIGDTITGFLGTVKTDLGNAVGDVGSFFETIGDDITGFFTALPGNLLALIGDIGSTLLNAGENLLEGLYHGVLQKWPQITAFFMTLPIRLIGYLAQANIWLLEKGAGIIAGLVSGLVNGVIDVVTFFGVTLPKDVLDAVVDVSEWLVTTGANLLKGLLLGIVNDGPKVITFFAVTLPHDILTALGNGLDLLYQKGRDFIGGLYTGVFDALQATWSWFVGLPGQILTAFENGLSEIGDGLYKLGQALMQAIINGIKSLGSALGDAITGALNAIPGVGGALHDLGIPGFASGGFAQGWAVVGERGPELAYFGGQGAQIYPNGSAPMGGTSIGSIQIVVQGSADPRQTAIAVRQALLDLDIGGGVSLLSSARRGNLG